MRLCLVLYAEYASSDRLSLIPTTILYISAANGRWCRPPPHLASLPFYEWTYGLPASD